MAKISNCMQHTLPTNLKFDIEMLSPLKSTLLDIYPVKEGWKLFNRYNWAPKVFDFILEKEEENTTFRILVEFNFENQISTEYIQNLNILADRLNNSSSITILKKMMIVCDDSAFLSDTKSDIEFIQISKLFNSSLLQMNGIKSKLVA